MTPGRAPNAAALADEILSIPDYRGAVRRLEKRRAAHTPDLIEEFRSRAEEVNRKDPRTASKLGRFGERVARGMGDRDGRLSCLRQIAQAGILRGNFATALRALDQERALLDDVDDRLRVARVEAVRVQPLLHLERYRDAEAAGRTALETLQQEGDRGGVVRVRMALADLAFRLDRPRDALHHYSRIEEILPETPRPSLNAAIAANRANALEAVNRFHAAGRQFATARDLFASMGAEHTVAQVEYNTAYSEMLRGRFADALKRLAGAEETFREMGDDRHLSHITLDRAEIHLYLNMPEEAGNLARLAEDGFASQGLVKEAAQAALLAGRAAELLNDGPGARQCFRRAEEAFRALGLVERQVQCVLESAVVAEGEQRWAEAAAAADRAEELLENGMNPLSAASLGLLRARLEIATGDPEMALGLAESALDDCRRVHAPWIRIEAKRSAGKACDLLGRTAEAVEAYRDAIETLEAYRGGVPPDEYMSAFLSGRTQLYADIVELLIGQEETAAAFEFTERAKSRALVDLLADRRDRAPKPDSAEASSDRLTYLRERLTALYRRLFTSDNDERSFRALEESRRKAAGLEEEISRILREKRLRDGERASLETVEAPRLEDVRRDLEPDATLIEYFLTDDRVFIFVVTRDSVHVVSRDAGMETLRDQLESFYEHIMRQQHPQVVSEELILRATRSNLGKLAEILLDPIADALTGKRLIVIPHGVLHHLPFHALPWGDGWVADRFDVAYAPSAAVYGYCRRRGRSVDGPPSVFGVPDAIAPEIESESLEVARHLGSDRVYLREEATSARLIDEAQRSRILHIATHGMFRPKQPMLSAIRLADGWINLYDIYELQVKSDLVVLSCCESGTAEVTGGDEILGLNRAFLYAGTPALLTSQWRVSDSVTSEFMVAFYRNLSDSGDVVRAYGDAMAEVRKSHPHPFYWAPFFLTGRPVRRSTKARARAEQALPVGV